MEIGKRHPTLGNNVLIGAGVAGVSVLSSLLLFGGLRFHDLVIDAALVYVLFFSKPKR